MDNMFLLMGFQKTTTITGPLSNMAASTDLHGLPMYVSNVKMLTKLCLCFDYVGILNLMRICNIHEHAQYSNDKLLDAPNFVQCQCHSMSARVLVAQTSTNVCSLII